jgi:hypothetical protein
MKTAVPYVCKQTEGSVSMVKDCQLRPQAPSTTTTTTTTTEATEATANEATAEAEAEAEAEAQTETPPPTTATEATATEATSTEATANETVPPTTFGTLNCSILVNEGPKKIQIKCTNTLNLDIRTIDSIVGEKDTSYNINANIGLHTFVIALSDYSVTMIRETGTTLISADEADDYNNNPPNGTFIQVDKQESGKAFEFTFSINNIATEGNSAVMKIITL